MNGRPIEDDGAIADYLYLTTLEDLLYEDRRFLDKVSSSLMPH
jgi:hypothetical protein